MEIMRLVVTGPVGAGKSTFIRSVSEIEVVDTDRQATDEVADMKHKTTVALDFGRLQFGPQHALHLYGTPGQARFDFMWDILVRRAHAYIMLVAAHRPHEFRYARRMLTFMEQRTQVPLLLGMTHCDLPGAWAEDNLMLALGYVPGRPRPPVVVVNANDRTSVAHAIIALVQHSMEQQGCLIP